MVIELRVTDRSFNTYEEFEKKRERESGSQLI